MTCNKTKSKNFVPFLSTFLLLLLVPTRRIHKNNPVHRHENNNNIVTSLPPQQLLPWGLPLPRVIIIVVITSVTITDTVGNRFDTVHNHFGFIKFFGRCRFDDFSKRFINLCRHLMTIVSLDALDFFFHSAIGVYFDFMACWCSGLIFRWWSEDD